MQRYIQSALNGRLAVAVTTAFQISPTFTNVKLSKADYETPVRNLMAVLKVPNHRLKFSPHIVERIASNLVYTAMMFRFNSEVLKLTKSSFDWDIFAHNHCYFFL